MNTVNAVRLAMATTLGKNRAPNDFKQFFLPVHILYILQRQADFTWINDVFIRLRNSSRNIYCHYKYNIVLLLLFYCRLLY